MSSDAQYSANQHNSRFSTGPRTPEGKAVSSLNAMRHGLTGQNLILRPEEREAYDDLCASLMYTLAPLGELEKQLVQRLADTQWRLNRVAAHEANVLALAELEVQPPAATGDDETDAALKSAAAFRASHQALANISLYEQRLHRNFEKTLKQLREAQAARHLIEAAQREALHSDLMEKAIKARIHAEKEEIPFRPSDFGFLFSIREIDAEIERRTKERQQQNGSQLPNEPNSMSPSRRTR